MSRRIVGLDIGTCFIRTVIAEIDSDGRIEVIGLSKIPSQGVRNGIIVNIDAAKEAVQAAIEAAEQMAGVEVTEVWTSIGGSQVSSMKSSGIVGVDPKGISTSPLEIKPEAKERALKSAKSMLIPYDEVLLHIIPQEYLIDGKDYPDPIGNLGVRLEVKALLVKVSKSAQGNIAECIARAGYELRNITLKTLAAATATLHKDEMTLGSILIDLGGVLCPNHNVSDAIGRVLIFQNTVENTVFLRLHTELLKITVFDCEHFQFLAGTKHIGQADFSLGFLLISQNGVEHNRQLLRGRAG